MCVAQQCGPYPGPRQEQSPSEEEHLFFSWHGEDAILLLLTLPAPVCFHFVFTNGRCPLSSEH